MTHLKSVLRTHKIKMKTLIHKILKKKTIYIANLSDVRDYSLSLFIFIVYVEFKWGLKINKNLKISHKCLETTTNTVTAFDPKYHTKIF